MSTESQISSVIRSRLEPDDEIEALILIPSGWNNCILVISKKWVVQFKSIKELRKPQCWIPRDMIKTAHVSSITSGHLTVKSSDGLTVHFSHLSELQTLKVLPLLDRASFERAKTALEKRGSQIFELKSSGFLGGSLYVYENEIHANGITLSIDGFTTAELVMAGQRIVSSRPTLTRMALLAPLPGTALVPGLALQKKTVQDDRKAILSIVNAQSHITFEINPDDVGTGTTIANRINALAEVKMKKESNLSGSPSAEYNQNSEPPEADFSVSDLERELKKLDGLLASCLITESEYTLLKTKLLSKF